MMTSIKSTDSNILCKYTYEPNKWILIEDNRWCLFKRNGYVTNPTYHQILYHPLIEVYQLKNHNNTVVAWIVLTKLEGWNPVDFVLHFKIPRVTKPLVEVLYQDNHIKVYKSMGSLLLTYKG